MSGLMSEHPMIDVVKRLADQGKSQVEIAAETGYHQSWIAQLCRKAGIAFRRGRRPRPVAFSAKGHTSSQLGRNGLDLDEI